MATKITRKQGRSKRRSPARKDTFLRRFAANVERDELLGMLEHRGDERSCRLLEMLLDPAYRNHSFGRLCERVGMRSADVVDLFRKYKFDVGIVTLSRAAPQVMQSTVEDALNGDRVSRRLVLEVVGLVGKQRPRVETRVAVRGDPGPDLEGLVVVSQRVITEEV